MPANARQAGVRPVPLENYAACRSVSDDDLCAWCTHLCYRVGELSLCRQAEADGIWPSRCNADSYAQSCPLLHRTVLPVDVTCG